jgi:acyl-CoA synthetase (AMP-forming)/AMP-acid ligase II
MSVYERFELTRTEFPTRPFLIIPAASPHSSRQLSYAQVGTAASELIDSYRRAGYGRGHHIALLLGSRAEFYLHWLAVNAIGATLVPVGAELVDDEMAYLIQHAEVDLVVSLGAVKVVAVEQAPHAMPVAAAPRSATTALDAELDAAAIVFTSGSTGRPKGCVLSNQYFLSFGSWYRDLGGRCALRPGQERFITPLPPNHVNALAFSSMGALMTGGCIVQVDRFRSSEWWELVRETGATVMHYLVFDLTDLKRQLRARH